MNSFTKQKQTPKLKAQIYGCQEVRMGQRESQGVWGGTDVCTLLY